MICLDCYECTHWFEACDRGVKAVPGGVKCVLFEAHRDGYDRNVDSPGQIGIWDE